MKSIIINNDSKIKLSNNNIIIENSKGIFNESLDCISLIIIQSKATLTTDLINETINKDIPIIICSDKKLPNAVILPYYGFFNRFETISKQINWSDEQKQKVSLKIIENKILNQQKVIELLFHKPNAYQNYLDSINIENKTRQEAFVARKYFYKLFGNQFNRRDYDNDINKKLNYGYAIIASIITNEIVSHGYLTEIGINHFAKTNNFNLTYDIIEPFRQIVDMFVYNTKSNEFNTDYKIQLVNLLYNEIVYNNKKYSVMSAIKEYVLSIIKALNGKSKIGTIEII